MRYVARSGALRGRGRIDGSVEAQQAITYGSQALTADESHAPEPDTDHRAWLALGDKCTSIADMDGYQFLPTSHSIRAYLAVLYRL
jgi:hypothetical protein